MDVLDTTAFSALMRGEHGMLDFLRARLPADVAVVPPVVAEIEYGIQRLEPGTGKRMLLEERRTALLAEIRVLGWTPEASERFGVLKASLEHQGTPVDDFDIAVAKTATAPGAGVVTASLPHFSRMEGLRCRHWAG
jgi:predicted nucleic acid-binding protein